MDLIPEYRRARDWVRDSLDFDKDARFNTFEVSATLHPLVPSGEITRGGRGNRFDRYRQRSGS